MFINTCINSFVAIQVAVCYGVSWPPISCKPVLMNLRYSIIFVVLKHLFLMLMIREQGWCRGESTRLSPVWFWFDSRNPRHILSLLLVLVFAPRGFSSGTPVFPSPQKTNISKSNSIWRVSPYCKAYLIISSWNYALYKFKNFVLPKADDQH